MRLLAVGAPDWQTYATLGSHKEPSDPRGFAGTDPGSLKGL